PAAAVPSTTQAHTGSPPLRLDSPDRPRGGAARSAVVSLIRCYPTATRRARQATRSGRSRQPVTCARRSAPAASPVSRPPPWRAVVQVARGDRHVVGPQQRDRRMVLSAPDIVERREDRIGCVTGVGGAALRVVADVRGRHGRLGGRRDRLVARVARELIRAAPETPLQRLGGDRHARQPCRAPGAGGGPPGEGPPGPPPPAGRPPRAARPSPRRPAPATGARPRAGKAGPRRRGQVFPGKGIP